MQAEKLKKTNKSITSGSLNKKYQWFNDVFFSKIQASFNEFIGPHISLKFVSLSEKNNILFAGEDYFVTRIKITKDLDLLFRISQDAVEIILNDTFGDNGKPFKLEEMTELEAKILTSVNDFLYKSFEEILVNTKKIHHKSDNKDDYHLTFFVKGSANKTGKLILTLPALLVPEMPSAEKIYNFEIDSFPATLVPVDLLVGTSKIQLSDLKNIDIEDIVVLEQSNINKMTITVEEFNKEFRLNPDPSLIVSVDDNGGKIMEENKVKNMWDSIQVDISAEFEQVKIPLGDLRQISEGLVVDIGSVYENKIDLKVEDKIIASGELVIINDRYGVRVDTLYKDDLDEQSEAIENEASELEEEAEEDEFNEEDFDYSNFEIEDENI